MQLFYADPQFDSLDADVYTLPDEESRHCVKVLRMQAGEVIYLTDGRGLLATARIVVADAHHCEVRIEHRQVDYQRNLKHLTVAIAPPKNVARLEWFIEKAVEVGVDTIVPIVCDYSERTVLRRDRMQKVAITAMKQSLRAYCPLITEVVPLRQYLAGSDVAGFRGLRLIAHCEGDQRVPLQQVLTPATDMLMLIGPEGDFSASEVTMAAEAGFIPITLGAHRLRTETAALYAVMAFNYVE